MYKGERRREEERLVLSELDESIIPKWRVINMCHTVSAWVRWDDCIKPKLCLLLPYDDDRAVFQCAQQDYNPSSQTWLVFCIKQRRWRDVFESTSVNLLLLFQLFMVWICPFKICPSVPGEGRSVLTGMEVSSVSFSSSGSSVLQFTQVAFFKVASMSLRTALTLRWMVSMLDCSWFKSDRNPFSWILVVFVSAHTDTKTAILVC